MSFLGKEAFSFHETKKKKLNIFMIRFFSCEKRFNIERRSDVTRKKKKRKEKVFLREVLFHQKKVLFQLEKQVL